MSEQPASETEFPESGITMLTGSDLPGVGLTRAEGTVCEVGEAACYAHLVCPDCGSVVAEGHGPDCPAVAGSGSAGQ